MTEVIRKDWDSAFFGFEVGSLVVNDKLSHDSLLNLLEHAKEKYRLLYLFTGTKESIILNSFEKNCSYIDERIIFEKEINENVQVQDNIVEFNTVKDARVLYPLAFESGKYSRFKMDPCFSEEQFKQLYRLMIDNALTKEYADKVFMKRSDKAEGFVTVKKRGDALNIGLIGVDPDAQGRGIGTVLMRKVESYASKAGVKKIRVLTQKQNRVARNYYEKQGFQEARHECIFHLWF